MIRLGYYSFTIWFILLPFTVLSSVYLKVISVDKLMAPILIVLWVITFASGRCKFEKGRVKVLLIGALFFFLRNLSKWEHSGLYTSLLWQDAIYFGYFSLPLLYIDVRSKVRTAYRLVSFNAIVGCMSSLLVAIGILTLPYGRVSETRISALDYQRVIGIITSFGDLAQYSAYLLLIAFFVPSSLLLKDRQIGKFMVRLAVLAIVMFGLFTSQSRNFFLSLIVSLIVAFVFYYRGTKTARRILFNSLFTAVGVSVVTVVLHMSTNIISLLSNLGGTQAQGTALTRLEQYQYAHSVIMSYPMLGPPASYYLRYREHIDYVHNMWLGQMARGGIASAVVLLLLLIYLLRWCLTLVDSPETKSNGIVAIGYMSAVLISTLFYPADSSLFYALLGMNASIVSTLKTSETHYVVMS